MEKIAAIILAAGKGTRMGDAQGSQIPKVMFTAHSRPLLGYSVDNLRRSGIDKIVVVVGYKKELVMEYLDGEVEYAVQEKLLGTGHAVMMAEGVAKNLSEATLICYGDMPLFKVETIQKLIEEFNAKKPTIAMLTVNFEDPMYWVFGRIIRNAKGEIIGSVEQKDCNEEQLKIKESNPCFYIFDSKWLWDSLKKLKAENAQKEYYLTDLIEIAIKQGKKIIASPVLEETEALGVNTPEQLKQVEEILKERSEDYVHI